MKKKNIELDVDFIGGQEPLTKEEEKLISDFFQSRKKGRREFPGAKKGSLKTKTSQKL